MRRYAARRLAVRVFKQRFMATAAPVSGFESMDYTKQLATLGPASDSAEMIESLFLAGVDAFRLNFSHGEHSQKRKIIKIIRDLEVKHSYPICILADLQGPKLRIGVFQDEIESVQLTAGDSFRFDLDLDNPGDQARVPLPHPEIINSLKPGDMLQLDDGKLQFQVAAVGPGHVDATVIVGGILSERKGVNVPSLVLPIPALTPKDEVDLEFILEEDLDWVALSFVQQVNSFDA